MWKHSELVCIKNVEGKGRGVFARCEIPEGTVIERCPCWSCPCRM